MKDDLPRDVRYLLETCIDSIEQLQVLLLLHAHSEKIWTTQEIASELRSVATSIQTRLDELYKRNVLLPSKENEHKFLPSSAAMQKLIDVLVSENQLRPYKIIDAIYSTRDKSIQDFANAFKVRGEKS